MSLPGVNYEEPHCTCGGGSMCLLTREQGGLDHGLIACGGVAGIPEQVCRPAYVLPVGLLHACKPGSGLRLQEQAYMGASRDALPGSGRSGRHQGRWHVQARQACHPVAPPLLTLAATLAGPRRHCVHQRARARQGRVQRQGMQPEQHAAQPVPARAARGRCGGAAQPNTLAHVCASTQGLICAQLQGRHCAGHLSTSS